jgi:hypothetical protein
MIGGKLPPDPEMDECAADEKPNSQVNCDTNKTLMPAVMITKTPSFDRVLMTHSVQSLHLLISKRLCEGKRLEKARSIEGIASRRFLNANDKTYFSSLQTLNVRGEAGRGATIENGLCEKISSSRSIMCDINQNSDSQCKSEMATLEGKLDQQDDPMLQNADDNPSRFCFPFQFYQYWLLQCNTILFCLSLSVVLTHIFAYSQYQGLDQSNATILISMNGAANVVGRIGLGALTQHKKVGTIPLFITCYAIAGVACLIMTVWTSFAGLSVCVMCFGFFSAAFGPVLSEVTMDMLGVEHFNFGYGFLMISMAMGITLGAPTAGACIILLCLLSITRHNIRHNTRQSHVIKYVIIQVSHTSYYMSQHTTKFTHDIIHVNHTS